MTDKQETLTALCQKAIALGMTTTGFWTEVHNHEEYEEGNPAEAALAVLSDVRAGGTTCPKCQGTGEFVFQNGKRGPCFSCKGKGFTDHHDRVRNFGYNKHNPGRQMRSTIKLAANTSQ